MSAACGQEALVQGHRLWPACLAGSSFAGTHLVIFQPAGETTSGGPNRSLSRPQGKGVSKRMEPSVSSMLHSVRTRNNGHKLKQGSFRHCIKKKRFSP